MINKTIPDNPTVALQSYTKVGGGEDWLLMVFFSSTNSLNT